MTTLTLTPKAIVEAFGYEAREKETLVDCPVCGAPLDWSWPAYDRFGWVIGVTKCATCQVELLNPRLTAEGYEDFYASVYRQVTKPGQALYARALGRAIGLWLVEAGLHPEGRIADVGGGGGDVATGLREQHPEIAVDIWEPGAGDRAQAGAQGFQTYAGGMEDIAGVYDGAICVRAFDHVRHPVAALRQLQAAIKPGGWLYLDVVDVWHMRKRYGPEMFWKVDHPLYWTPGPLRLALKRSGWTIRREGYSLPSRASYLTVCVKES